MKVFLHIGAFKTGTTVIQSALASLRGDLAACGVHYPFPFGLKKPAAATTDSVTVGNAFALGYFLNPGLHSRLKGTRPDVADWVRACIADADGRDLLFSSEAMFHARADETRELCAIFEQAGYEITVILYVRHLVDHAISLYLQDLKQGQPFGSNGRRPPGQTAFLDIYKCRFLASLEPFLNVLPPERVIVRLYDKERDDLVGHFLRLVTPAKLQIPPAARVVNRSPTPAEQVVFEYLGQLPNGPRICRRISQLLLNRPAPAPIPMVIAHSEIDGFTRRNKPIVDELNTRFLKDNGTLRIMSDRVSFGDPASAPPEEVNAVFAECIALLDDALRPRRPAAKP